MAELTYRIQHDGTTTDVQVELADGTTVGELARAIAAHVGASVPEPDPTLVERPGPDDDRSRSRPVPVDPALAACEGAPRCGATIEVVAARAEELAAPTRSPVVLRPLGVDTDSDGVRLAYGSTDVGAARIRVDTALTVAATGSLDRLEVDGTPVRGSVRVGHGALLRVGADSFAVRVDGPLDPPADGGPWREHGRTPAVVESHEPHPIELPTPPTADRLPGFPFLSAAVPLLMGGAMWYATGSLAVAGFVLFSVAFVVASGIEVRREHRKERRFREQQFRDDLATKVADIRALRTDELRRAHRDLPSANEVATWARGDQGRLWERWPQQPMPLRVSLGVGPAPSIDPVLVPDGGRADLRSLLVAAAEDLAEVLLPTVADLGASGLGICGTGDRPAALARAVLLQLVGTLGPEHLRFVVDVGPDRAPSWDWMHWLPHDVATGIASLVDGDRSDDRFAVTLVDRTDGPAAVPDDPDGVATVATIWIAGTPAELPDGIGTVVELHHDRGTLRRHDGPAGPFEPDRATLEECMPVARSLAPLRARGDGAATASTVTLREVLADPTMLDRNDSVVAAWARSRAAGPGLPAPVARSGAGVIHLDLRADGPHALVAGTTGSGKSELLRTLVTSLALHHPPDRLTFLLVDYKGGAAFRPIASLPHVVGLVTDLGPAEARRALVSLRAEVRRRERIVAHGGVTDVTEMPGPDAPPALLVVVDEFATLAAEQPALLDGLMDVAQRGRSLGVHLLLATQRPTGVITDAIRANVNLRLALRVADEQDSRDVVDLPTAAHLPTDRPGRAVLRLGPRHATTIQIATTAGRADPGPRVRCRSLHDDGTRGADDASEESMAGAPTEVQVAVERCIDAAAVTGLAPPRRPWLDPLPTHLEPGELSGPAGRDGVLVVGLADRPHEQCQPPARIDLRERGGLLVLGAPRSGRSTALRTIADAALGDRLHPTTVHAIDSTRSLSDLVGQAGVGGPVASVIGTDDVERTLRLLRSLRARCRDGLRTIATDGTGAEPGRVVVLVDGIGAFADRHERLNRGEAIELLTSIATEGPRTGVHVAVTAGRLAELPPGLLAALDRRLVLRCATEDGAAAELVDTALPPGRGMLDGELIQLALPRARIAARRDVGTDLVGDGRLPSVVERSSLPASSGWQIVVGLRHDDLGPASIDLSRHGALVLGPPRSGRSTALRLLSDQLLRSTERSDDGDVSLVVLDGHRPDGAVAALEGALADARGRVDARSAEPDDADRLRAIVAIDDLPELLDTPDGTTADELLDHLIRLAPAAGVRVLATGEADAAARCYGSSMRRLRSGRTGILLRPDPDLHPSLLHTSLPLHDELSPATGRGWVVSPDGVQAVQLAR